MPREDVAPVAFGDYEVTTWESAESELLHVVVHHDPLANESRAVSYSHSADAAAKYAEYLMHGGANGPISFDVAEGGSVSAIYSGSAQYAATTIYTGNGFLDLPNNASLHTVKCDPITVGRFQIASCYSAGDELYAIDYETGNGDEWFRPEVETVAICDDVDVITKYAECLMQSRTELDRIRGF